MPVQGPVCPSCNFVKRIPHFIPPPKMSRQNSSLRRWLTNQTCSAPYIASRLCAIWAMQELDKHTAALVRVSLSNCHPRHVYCKALSNECSSTSQQKLTEINHYAHHGIKNLYGGWKKQHWYCTARRRWRACITTALFWCRDEMGTHPRSDRQDLCPALAAKKML